MNARDQNGDAAVHAIVRRTPDKHKFDCLLALLINSDAGYFDINLITADNNTALHLAVKVRFTLRLYSWGEGGRGSQEGRRGKEKGGGEMKNQGRAEGNQGRAWRIREGGKWKGREMGKGK